MCLTQRENGYYHVAQTWIRYILHIVGDFGINIKGSDVENANIFGLQKEPMSSFLMEDSICTK